MDNFQYRVSARTWAPGSIGEQCRDIARTMVGGAGYLPSELRAKGLKATTKACQRAALKQVTERIQVIKRNQLLPDLFDRRLATWTWPLSAEHITPAIKAITKQLRSCHEYAEIDDEAIATDAEVSRRCSIGDGSGLVRSNSSTHLSFRK